MTFLPGDQKKGNNFKFYCEKGNNSLLVRSIIKERVQMVQVLEESSFSDGVNFIWSPWRKNNYVNELPIYEESPFPVKREELKIYNKLPQNHHLSNKKTFFTNL